LGLSLGLLRAGRCALSWVEVCFHLLPSWPPAHGSTPLGLEVQAGDLVDHALAERMLHLQDGIE
jgi:hypothetical protein